MTVTHLCHLIDAGAMGRQIEERPFFPLVYTSACACARAISYYWRAERANLVVQLARFFYIQVNENLQFRKGLYKKQKRQDWDHKAYHDAPSAI